MDNAALSNVHFYLFFKNLGKTNTFYSLSKINKSSGIKS